MEFELSNRLNNIYDNITLQFPILMRKIMLNTAVRTKTGLSNMEFLVLVGIGVGELKPSEISKIFSISKPNVTTLVDRLEKNGYVHRNHDDSDRRVVRVSLTDKGKKLVAKQKAITKKYMISVFDRMSDAEINELIESFESYHKMLLKMNSIF